MRKSRLLIPLLIFLIPLLFFYPLLKGYIPLPGDLLVGHYGPYNTLSLNGYAPGAVPHKAQGIDVVRELYPWKHFVIESYRNGESPFWNPYQFSGQNLLANFQSGALYPLNLVFFLSDFTTSWSLFIFLIPLLSILFMYLFLRSLAVSKEASLLGGLVFAFSSYMTVWMEYGNIGHTMLWLPLALFASEKLTAKYHAKWAVLLLISLCFSFFAGYIQGYFYTTGVVFLFLLVRSKVLQKKSIPSLLLILVLLLLPLAIGAIQLLPTLSLFSQSSRGNYSLSQIQQLLNPWWYMVTMIVPDFFGHPASRNSFVPLTYIERVSYFGVIPFFLALYALITRRKEKIVLLFGLISLFSLLLTTDLFITKYFYQIPIPVLSTTVPTRLLSLFVFSGAVLSAFGMEVLMRHKNKKEMVTVFIGGGLVLGSLWIFVLLQQSDTFLQRSVVIRNMLLPTFFFTGMAFLTILLFFQKRIPFAKHLIIASFFLLTVADLFYFFHKITPFSPREYVYPQTPVVSYIQKNAGINRYWGYGSGVVTSNFQMIDHTYSVEGNDPLHSKEYEQLLASSTNGIYPKDIARADSLIAPGFGRGNFTANPYRTKVLSMLGVKYIVSKEDNLPTVPTHDTQTFPTDTYKLVFQENPWQIYEGTRVAQRAFLTDKYKVTNQQQFFSDFYNKSFNEQEEILLFEDPKLQRGVLTKKEVSIDSYKNGEVVLRTSADASSLLFLSDTFSPEWHVEINGKEGHILKANYAFRAVVVPEGSHTVRFFYSSPFFQKGLIISLVAIFVSLVLLLKVRIKSL